MFPFEQSSTSPFGQTNSVFGQNNSSNNPFSPKPFGSTTPFGLQTDSSISGGTSTDEFGAAYTPCPFGASCSPAFGSSMHRSSSTPAFGSSSTSFGGSSGFGQKPAFGGIGIPTSIQKQVEPVWKRLEPFRKPQLEEVARIRKQRLEAVGATSTPAIGATRTSAIRMLSSTSIPVAIVTDGWNDIFSIFSSPTIAEEYGDTSGQTATLESISTMPSYKYERFESCFAIAGADYCVIAADFPRDHSKISQLSEKSVMVPFGFQGDVKALQEVLSADNLDVLARLSETEAVGLAKTVFESATHTGDKLEIVVLNASGVHCEYMDLRKNCDRHYGQVFSRKRKGNNSAVAESSSV